jgi:hypothetical protein
MRKDVNVAAVAKVKTKIMIGMVASAGFAAK